MDYSEDKNYCQPKKKSNAFAGFFSGLWRVLKSIFFAFSILGNLILLIIITMVVALGYVSYKSGTSFSSLKSYGSSNYSQYVINKGFAANRIAVIEVANIITVETSEGVRQQFDLIAEDPTIKGVIIRIQSPGGSVVASDQLYYLIGRLRERKSIPIVAYMAGLAASGGYYTAVACDKIIAEPTTITGSIGVVMQAFTMKQLFEDKLGISPVTVKSGERKDWPNTFKDITEEQLVYLDDKLIRPAYDRFVDLVDKGRPHLNRKQIELLADGSIYYAQEAMDNGLIDTVAYFDAAVEIVSNMAGISSPEVIGYDRIFGWADIMQLKTGEGVNLMATGRDIVSDMQSPKLMYIWQLE